MPDYTVARRGTDTSGRPILATAYFWAVWCAMLADPRLAAFAWKIVVVQGAFMARLGGGATASAGYHNLAGCWDVRTWNLTPAEQQLLWDVAAEYGIWFWKRDLNPAHGGMDEHGHAVAGWDRPLAAGAATQWAQAQARRDGLARNGPDYMLRRRPIVLTPPARLLQEDPMAAPDAQKKLDQILANQERLERSLGKLSDAERSRFERDRARDKAAKSQMIGLLGSVVDQLTEIGNDVADDATKAQVRAVKTMILSALAANPDVDGADNPASAETTQP